MSWFCDSKCPRLEGNHNYTTALGFFFVSVSKGWKGIIVIFINLDVEAPSWYMLLAVKYTQDLVALFLISKGIVCTCVVNTNTVSPQKQAGNLPLYRIRVLTSCCKCWTGLKMDKKSSEKAERKSIFYSICHPRISKCFLSYPPASWTILPCDRQMLSCPLYK